MNQCGREKIKRGRAQTKINFINTGFTQFCFLKVSLGGGGVLPNDYRKIYKCEYLDQH